MTLSHQSEIHRFVQDHRDEARQLLDAMVARHSITWFKEGVDAVAGLVLAAMPAGFEHQRIPQDRFGDHHMLRRPGRNPAARVVLAGHLDTLCPEDPKFNRVYEEGDHLRGPGVMDMKGGDVVIIHALRALEAVGLLDRLDVTCIFNSDEELGSPTSHGLFESMAGRADAALVYEASLPHGTIVTTRRGVSRNRLHIEGVEHHFGMLKTRKVSALHEAAVKTLAIEALNREDGSVVANVGRVEGGLAANKVAHRATLDYETRCWDPQLHQVTIDQARAMASTPQVEGCRIRFEPLSYRPVMKPPADHRWLFDLAVSVAGELGQPVEEEHRGGVSDACWLAHAGIPTLDGLGPRGDHDFTPDEYFVTESLFERIELSANLLVAIADRGMGATVR